MFDYALNDKNRLYAYSTMVLFLFIIYHFFFVVVHWFDLLSFGYPPTSALMPADPHVFWRFSLYGNISGLAFNVLGPTLLLKLFNSNLYIVFLFDLSLVVYSIYVFSQALNRTFCFVFSVLMLNPIILAQIFYPNKELYMLICSFLFLSYCSLQQRKYLYLGLFLLAFTKIEYATLSILWLILIRFPKRVWFVTIITLVFSISALYNYIPGIDQKLTVLKASQQSSEDGLTVLMQRFSSDYHVFVLTILPKTFNALIGGAFDFFRNPQAFIQGFPTFISSVVMTVFVVVAFYKCRKRKMGPEHIFVLLWFIAVATVPFSLHRYLIPCYPFLYSIVFVKDTT